MKINQCLLAVVLFISVTVTQSAQAGVWEWVNPFRLVTYVARTAWNHLCPITKHNLSVFEENEKNEMTAKVEELLDREKKSKAAIDQQFIEINTKHDGLAVQAQDIVLGSKLLQQDAASLAEQLKALNEKHDKEMPEVDARAQELTKKYTAVLVLMGQVKQQVEENARVAKSLDYHVKNANEGMDKVTGTINQVKENVALQEKKNKRIGTMAKEIIQRTVSIQKQCTNTLQLKSFDSVSKNKQ